MATIILRLGKGSPLTNAELDGNFTNLNNDIATKASTSSLASVAFTGSYSSLTGTPTLGTAAAKDIPATGNASATQVVYGSDTRLSDARTPTAHNQAWSTITGTPTTLSGYGITDAYSSSNPAGYITGITSSNVTTALGFTPYNATNPNGYITTAGARAAISVTGSGSYDSATGVITVTGGVTSFNTRTGAIVLSSTDVTTALGFTPYNSTNPNSYITTAGARSAISVTGSGSYDSATGVITVTGGVTSVNSRTGAVTITSGDVTGALGYTPYNSSNPSGYITSSALSGYLTSASAASTYLPLAGGTATNVTLGVRVNSSVYGGNTTGMTSHSFPVEIRASGAKPTLTWHYESVATRHIALDADGALNVYNPGESGGAVFKVGGNTVLHAGNYTSYDSHLRALGYASASTDWNSLGNGYQNSILQVDPSNFASTASGPTAASYTYGTLINFASMSSSQAQIYISHAGNDLIFRGGWNGNSWQAWNKVLTNQNYNSYSPTLTGGNASGTWGINITGTASGETLSTVTSRGGSTSNSVNLASGGNHYQGHFYYDSYDSAGNHYPHFTDGGSASGAKVNWRLYTGGANTHTHIWNTSTAQFVTRLESTVRVDAPIFYDSNNTGYYVDPASGSNLAGTVTVNGGKLLLNSDSGSYGQVQINSSNTSTEASISFGSGGSGQNSGGYTYSGVVGLGAYGNVKSNFYFGAGYNAPAMFIPNASAYVEAINSFRAPIFYDSNDTAYFINGDGVSSLLGLAIRGDKSTTGTANQIFFWDAGNTTTSAIGFKANGGNFPNPTGFGDGYNTYFTMDGDGRGWVFRRGVGGSDFNSAYTAGWILNNGVWQASSSMRAPIFYDSNDTTYYVDPNNTSNIYGLNITGASHKYLYLNPGNGYEAMVRYNGGSGSGWYVGKRTASVLVGTESFHFYSEATSATVSGIDPNGNFFTSGSSRAPIFYDNDDTAYYVNPNSVTRLYSTSVYAGNEASNTGANGSTEGFILRGNYNSNTWAKKFHNYDNGSGIQLYLAETVGASAWNTLQGWGYGLGYTSRVFGSFRADSALYSPVFYDTDNTGYYCDPTGTSILNTIGFNGTSANAFGNYWAGGGGYPGYQYIGGNNRFGFSSTSGYIDVYTDGNYYGGIDLYGANRLVPLFDANQGGGALYSSIVYDTNNTGKYVDPHSFSSLTTLGLTSYMDVAGAIYSRDWYYILNAASNGWNTVINRNGGNNWIVYGGDSVRAPVFYDNDDTNYYVNPNSFSQLSYANINAAPGGRTLSLGGDQTDRVYSDAARSSLVINATQYPHLYINATTNINNTYHGAVFSMTGNLSGGGYRRWGMGIANTDPDCWSWGYADNNTNPHYSVGGVFGYTGTYSKMWLNTGGSLMTTGDMRAPIFYDSNNTGYFVDPGGDSGVRAAYFNGNLWINPRSESYGEGITFNMPSRGTWGGLRWYRNGPGSSFSGNWAFGYFGNESNDDIGFHNGTNGWRLDQSFNMTSTGSVRSPIFYDSNDTGYYVDPNSTSRMNSITVGNGASSYIQMLDDESPNGLKYIHGNSDLIGFLNGYGSWIFRVDNNGTSYTNASSRAPIFYDLDNTGYYCNPNGDSNISGLVVNGMTNLYGGAYAYGNGSVNGSAGVGLNVFSNGGNGAIFAFHRGGYYAVNMGLDSDNVIRIGGWSASANRLQMDMSGNLTMNGNVTAYSDERLKKDWAPLSTDFIEQLAQVKSGTYTRIDSDERQAGVSAQGLQKFLPETVQTDASGTLSVNYGSAALVSAVELAKEVVDLRKRVAHLESLINKLIGD
jgi:hypothetical protein